MANACKAQEDIACHYVWDMIIRNMISAMAYKCFAFVLLILMTRFGRRLSTKLAGDITWMKMLI
jgi:hypothetical protein